MLFVARKSPPLKEINLKVVAKLNCAKKTVKTAMNKI
jgi:hypothetical protein